MNLLCLRGLATLLINIAWLAPSHAGVRETADINRILRSVSDGRCDEAIQYLAERLQSKQPELQLLAGSMYDQGSCVERNWEKATQLYQQAALGGMSDDALPRLVSIDAVGYRDPAAALWWAAQRPAMHRPPDSREIDMSTAPSEDEDPFLRYLWATGVIVLKEFGAPPAQIPSWDTKNTIHIARAIYSPNMLEFITVSP